MYHQSSIKEYYLKYVYYLINIKRKTYKAKVLQVGAGFSFLWDPDPANLNSKIRNPDLHDTL